MVFAFNFELNYLEFMKDANYQTSSTAYWMGYWHQFKKHRLGFMAFLAVAFFGLAGIFAPLLASSKPLMVLYEGSLYFPLFRYLFYSKFYTKHLDLFFNLLIFIFPAMLAVAFIPRIKTKRRWFLALCGLQLGLFLYIIYNPMRDPAADLGLSLQRLEALKSNPQPNWTFDLRYMNSYARLNQLVRYRLQKEQYLRLSASLGGEPQTLFFINRERELNQIKRDQLWLENHPDDSRYLSVKASLDYLVERRQWLETESQNLRWMVMPLLSHFHWEDDAGGVQSLNQQLPWYELTRINHKDLLAALIFGVRISMVVGFLAVAIALVIAVPLGAVAGFYGGMTDMIVSRFTEVWEAMPTFFMLLMAVSIIQSKSIFIVIAIIGLFGWTGFSRFLRGEFFKQRHLPYVEACFALGYSHRYIMFVHILPNAIPPVLTLLPFAIMGAISSEAGLSFLGLGEEGSCSWGVLMDEGRTAFPGQSNLLWPPALFLTTLLVAIALVGDALRDTFDPKMHKS